MRNLLLLILLCLTIGGCAGHKYGNHLKNTIEVNSIVDDAIIQLKDHYPPAITKLHLDQDISSDYFYTSLINDLRTSGYEIYEQQPTENKVDDALYFKYIIDAPKDTNNIVRLTLFIGEDVMSCGYDINTLEPISVWTKGVL